MPKPNPVFDRLAQVMTREFQSLRNLVKLMIRRALVSLFHTYIPFAFFDLYTPDAQAARSSRKSVAVKKPRPSKGLSRNTDMEDNLDHQPITPEPAQKRLKKSSLKPPPTQTDDESDDLAIKKPKTSKKVDKGKARATESLPETFESAGTDVDIEDSRPGPSNAKLLSTKKRALYVALSDMDEPPMAVITPNREDASEELRPRPKKRGLPRKDEVEEGPPPKRGKMRKGPAKSKSKRQARASSPKPKSTVAMGRKEKPGPSIYTSDAGKEGYTSQEDKASGSNRRKDQWRTLDDRSGDEKRGDPPGDDRPNLNLNRVRLDSIPPGGVIIRKENGIVEKLLPPVMYVRFRCLRFPTPDFSTAANLRGKPQVTEGRPGAPINELFLPIS